MRSCSTPMRMPCHKQPLEPATHPDRLLFWQSALISTSILLLLHPPGSKGALGQLPHGSHGRGGDIMPPLLQPPQADVLHALHGAAQAVHCCRHEPALDSCGSQPAAHTARAFLYQALDTWQQAARNAVRQKHAPSSSAAPQPHSLHVLHSRCGSRRSRVVSMRWGSVP